MKGTLDDVALHSLSLCSGIGGLDLAIESAAPGVFAPIALVEGEGYAACVLKARMEDEAIPACPIWSDVRTVCDAEFRDYVRERTGGAGIDFVFGGIPCQPHSVAGKRRGAADERDLWPDTVRILETYRPWLFFLENVPGMLGYVSENVVPALRRLGYIVPRPLLLEAAAVGASQKRERLFVMGYAADGGRKKRAQTHSQESGSPNKKRNTGKLSRGSCGPRDAVAHPSDARHAERPGERRDDGPQQPAAERRSGALGDGDGCGRWTQGNSGVENRTDSASGALGDTESRGRREAECGQASVCGPDASGGRPFRFPPGPGLGGAGVVDRIIKLLDEDGPDAALRKYRAELAETLKWCEVLRQRPDLAPATIEPEIRGLADGIPGRLGPHRTDQLRALGNAVVPDCGAAAFLILLGRLREVLQ